MTFAGPAGHLRHRRQPGRQHELQRRAPGQQSITVVKAAQAITFTSTAPTLPKVGTPTRRPRPAARRATPSRSPSTARRRLAARSTARPGSSPSPARPAPACRRQPGRQRGYLAAPQAQQSITVGKAAQTITFTSTAPSSPDRRDDLHGHRHRRRVGQRRDVLDRRDVHLGLHRQRGDRARHLHRPRGHLRDRRQPGGQRELPRGAQAQQSIDRRPRPPRRSPSPRPHRRRREGRRHLHRDRDRRRVGQRRDLLHRRRVHVGRAPSTPRPGSSPSPAPQAPASSTRTRRATPATSRRAASPADGRSRQGRPGDHVHLDRTWLARSSAAPTRDRDGRRIGQPGHLLDRRDVDVGLHGQRRHRVRLVRRPCGDLRRRRRPGGQRELLGGARGRSRRSPSRKAAQVITFTSSARRSAEGRRHLHRDRHRRRLGQPGHLLDRRRVDVGLHRQRVDRLRDASRARRDLRRRREPGRQRELSRGTAGPADRSRSARPPRRSPSPRSRRLAAGRRHLHSRPPPAGRRATPSPSRSTGRRRRAARSTPRPGWSPSAARRGPASSTRTRPATRATPPRPRSSSPSRSARPPRRSRSPRPHRRRRRWATPTP